MLKTYLIRHLGRDHGTTCTFPRAELAILSVTNNSVTVTCDNEYTLELYELAEEIRANIPQGLKAEDCKVKLHTWWFEDIKGKKQSVDISCKNMDVVKNKQKEKPVGRLPNLMDDEEIQESLRGGSANSNIYQRKSLTPAKSSPSLKGKRGVTPADTTAPNSRGTQTPAKKRSGVSAEDLTQAHILKKGKRH